MVICPAQITHYKNLLKTADHVSAHQHSHKLFILPYTG